MNYGMDAVRSWESGPDTETRMASLALAADLEREPLTSQLFRDEMMNIQAQNIRSHINRWGSVAVLLLTTLPTAAADTPDDRSIAEKTKVHRLSTTNRAIYDAFAYVNRIPEEPKKSETPDDLAGRIFGRLANQEGRILLKLPPGMDRQTYQAFKTFFRYGQDGSNKVGNCAACHVPVEFTDFKNHVVARGGTAKPTPSLRNLDRTEAELERVIMDKIAAAKQKRSGEADEISDAYAKITITKQEVPGIVKFLGQLKDVSDGEFRTLILDSKLLDTSEDIE